MVRTWWHSLLLVAWSAMALGPTAHAHEVRHEVTRTEAVVLSLSYADGTPFAHEACEVRRVGDTVPLLAGRTDAEGRLAFLPPTEGRYAVRALSEDGHGASFEFESGSVEVAAGSLAATATRDRSLLQLLAGVLLILALFVGLRLLTRRAAEGSRS